MTTNHLTESDKQAVQSFLRDHSFSDLAQWGRYSDYLWIDAEDVWVDLDDQPVDLEVECFRHIEAAGEHQDEQRYGF